MPAGNRGQFRFSGPGQPGATPWRTVHGSGPLTQRPLPCPAFWGYYYFASDVAGGTLYQCQLASGLSAWVAVTPGMLLPPLNGPAAADVGLTDQIAEWNAAAAGNRTISVDRLGGFVHPAAFQARLTLSSGTAVTTTDVTAATTIYLTPFRGNRIALYDGTRWRLYVLAEISLALGTLTSGLPYDVFIYDNAGTLTLELLAWASTTARATALVLQDGVYCKTGGLTRRYCGTFYTTAATTTEDSAVKRFVWNYYNQVPRRLSGSDATSHTYNGGYRQWNNVVANRVEFVIGVTEQAVLVTCVGEQSAGAGVSAVAGVGLDLTNSANAFFYVSGGGGGGGTPATIIPTVGYHALNATESTASAGIGTFTTFHIHALIMG